MNTAMKSSAEMFQIFENDEISKPSRSFQVVVNNVNNNNYLINALSKITTTQHNCPLYARRIHSLIMETANSL